MLADFQITNASEEGFTLITPTLADGSYTFNYTLGFTNSENTIPFTVYYLVGREGGANNQFIFFEDPIEIDALYGSPNNYHSTRYLITGENRDILDYKEFTVEYIDGADWLGWPSGSDDYLHLDLSTENLPLGTYRARIHGSTFYTQATGSVDVIVNVVDGFDIFNQFNEVRFDQYLYRNETRSAYVDNSRQAQGEWTASTTTPWITLLNTSGNFLTPEERENYRGDSSVEYTFNVEGITALPNNSTGTGTITFSSEDVRFPDKSIEINYVKEFPQITALSQT